MSSGAQAQKFLTSMEVHLHKMFIAGTVFGALCCFARADYNLPMFAFLYVMFDHDDVSLILKHTERQIKTHVFDGYVLLRRLDLAILLGPFLVLGADG